MPTVEEIGNYWVHPKSGQVRYYLSPSVAEELDIPIGSMKVWMDRFGKVHVVGCRNEDMEIEIVRKLDTYMRGNRKVVGAYNTKTVFHIVPTGTGEGGIYYNAISYDNIESAVKRILALRKAGLHIISMKREVTRHGEVYNISMSSSDYYQYLQTPGYQKVDSIDMGIFDEIYMTYHGEDVRREQPL